MHSALLCQIPLFNTRSKSCTTTKIGYGFLSESAPFAQSLVESNITWVGPPPDVLHLFGDKIQARALARRSDVPVVRGSGNLESGEECLDVLKDGDVRLPAIMKVCMLARVSFIACFVLSLLDDSNESHTILIASH